MMLSYYPGCSLEGTARDYAESISGICSALDIQLEEIPDWNCCGATAAHSIDHKAAIELPFRNVKLASEMESKDLLVPCPMCFNRLKTATFNLQNQQQDYSNLHLPERLPNIWDLANYFAQKNLLKAVAKNITTPLKGLKVVCYYGCMANRPPEITGEKNYEDPQSLDVIMRNLGCQVISWPYKTDCCGASQAISRRDIVSQLVGKLFDMAERVGADAFVVSCQMCQANLDMYQKYISNTWGRNFSFPIYYFSELIGLACEVPGVKKWLSRHITEPTSLLHNLELL